MIGRKRAFAIGCVIYGCGSLITSLAQSLPVLLLGWSFLEGVGAALILPAIVALVATTSGRAAAGGLRDGRGRGRDRRRGRPARRRLLHDVLLVALGVRGRGRGGARHPRAHAEDRRRPAKTRPRLDVVGVVLSARGWRCSSSASSLERVGLGRAEAGRAVVVRSFADRVARSSGACSSSGCSFGGRRAVQPTGRSRSSARRCCGTRSSAAAS